jgi:hypothetical protein
MYEMEITEGFDFSRFGEGVEEPSGGEYELETFKYIPGDQEDNKRLDSSYDTTHLTGEALSEIEERHLKDAVDTCARTIKKAYQYTGSTRLTIDDFKLSNGRLYLKDGIVELTDGVSGRYKPLSDLKPASGVGYPITRIKEIFPDLEIQGRLLERAGLEVLRNGLRDIAKRLMMPLARAQKRRQAPFKNRLAISPLT